MALLPRLFAALALVAPGAAVAGNLSATPADVPPTFQSVPAATPDLIFTLRGGVAVNPDYFGSNDHSVDPDFGFGLNFLRLPGGRTFGSSDVNNPNYGFGLSGSFGYIRKRDTSDYPELTGLPDVDASVELGLGLSYTSRNFDAFADIRYGVIGHESFVGEVGADLKLQATDRLTLSAGPRLFIGSQKYAQTYFGTVAPFAGGAFTASGGLLSAGVELGATYKINDNWGVEGAVTWDRFMNSAADSPIVQAGDRDQYGLRIGITRRITLDF